MLIMLRICEQAAPKIRRVLSHPGASLWEPLCLPLLPCLAGNRVSSSHNHVVLHTNHGMQPCLRELDTVTPLQTPLDSCLLFLGPLTLAFLPQPIQFQPAKLYQYLSFSLCPVFCCFCMHAVWAFICGDDALETTASSVAFFFHISWH